ncbi:MAG: type II toxin-antitoxin system HicA family toxin [Thermodesulforhabdaceae bacterium]|jgi:predicted RNA binding protein YcfA (HicA-like mRNA interferase family)
MPKIPPCSRNELIRKLKKLGFDGPYPGGRHDYMKRGKFRLIIPNPHRGEIDPVVIKEILRQAGISADEWLEA